MARQDLNLRIYALDRTKLHAIAISIGRLPYIVKDKWMSMIVIIKEAQKGIEHLYVD